MPSLSIIMPCHNRAHDLIKCLEAYDLQVGASDFEIIAVDDASSDSTYQVLSSYRPSRYTLRVERLATNQGPAAARNRGIELAASPLMLFVGDDILPASTLVWGHTVAHKIYRSKDIAVLGRIAWPDDMPVNTLMTHVGGIGAQQFSYHYLVDGQEYDFRHFYTSNISIKTELLRTLSTWFATDFRFAAYEDAELAYRLSKRGLHIRYASALLAYHYHYYNIWTFRERQLKAGMMACLLIGKHPRLLVQFRSHLTRIAALITHAQAVPAQVILELEDMLCHLLSLYEWNPNELLDQAYLGALEYFYYEGVISGWFGKSRLAQRLQGAHAQKHLLPLLAWFFEAAKQRNIPAIDASRLDWLVKGQDKALLNHPSINA